MFLTKQVSMIFVKLQTFHLYQILYISLSMFPQFRVFEFPLHCLKGTILGTTLSYLVEEAHEA